MKLIGFYNYTVWLTYAGAAAAICGIFFSASGHPFWGVMCLLFAGATDMFDGKVASTMKRNDAEKNFGIQIDSLCDLISFGVLPIAIGYGIGLSGGFFYISAVLYLICAIIRLAYFNVTEELRQQETDECRKTYTGLPITSAALIFPFFFCFLDIFQRAAILHGALLVVMALTGASFVMPFHIRKPRSKEQWALLGIGLVIAAGCIFVWVRFRMRIVR